MRNNNCKAELSAEEKLDEISSIVTETKARVLDWDLINEELDRWDPIELRHKWEADHPPMDIDYRGEF